MKSVGAGSTLEVDSTSVALTKFGGIDLSREAYDSSGISSTSDEVILSKLIKSGEIPFEGYLDSEDAGQQALETAFLAGSEISAVQTMPNAIAISAASAYVTKYKIGEISKDGIIGVSGAIKPNGAVSINRTVSAGLTTPFFTVDGEGTTIAPAAAGNKYEYTVNIATGISSVKITPTASAGVITISANGASQVVISGEESTSIALGAAGSLTKAYMTVKETGKVPKLYILNLTRA
jgi:hypothetical protein